MQENAEAAAVTCFVGMTLSPAMSDLPTTGTDTTSMMSAPSDGTSVSISEAITRAGSVFRTPRGLRGLGDKCVVCDKPTHSWREFTRHMRTHDPAPPDPKYLDDCLLPNGRYQCIVCGFQLLTKHQMRKHCIAHCPDFPFECPICASKFKVKRKFFQHYRTVHSGRVYACDQCGFTTAYKFTLKIHVLKHSGYNGKERCEVCFKQMASMAALRRHYLIHTGEKPHSCRVCPMRFKTKDLLKSHVKLRHLGIKRVLKRTKCPVCGKDVISQVFVEHMRHHTDEPTDTCCICNKRFYSTRHYTVHMDRVHIGTKNLPCLVCGKRFFAIGELHQHMAVHTKEKPFKCEGCGKAFAWKHKVKDHMKTHSEERPFKCIRCGEAFKWKHNLSNHVRAKHT